MERVTDLRNGDIVVFKTEVEVPRSISFLQRFKGEKPFTLENSETHALVVNIYGVVFVLIVKDGQPPKLTPINHIPNEIIAVYRNWYFDSELRNELAGEAVVGLYVTGRYPNSVYNTLLNYGDGASARVALGLHEILGVDFPIKIEDIRDGFSINSVLKMNIGYFLAEF